MNSLNIITTAEAKADIRELKKRIAKDNKTAAKEFAIKLKKSFVMLSCYPRIGKCRPEFSGNTAILFLPVMKHYLIVYTIVNGDLNILRVLSGYQDICALL